MLSTTIFQAFFGSKHTTFRDIKTLHLKLVFTGNFKNDYITTF